MTCKIDNEKTNGCDKISQDYCDNYNVLHHFYITEGNESALSKIQINNISELDRSALGLYIGKFVEQEINSSVVQLMRYAVGIDMPEFYCKRNPVFKNDEVQTQNKRIRLNQQDGQSPDSLKTIPLGDAYYALGAMRQEYHVFENYGWLSERTFLDAWRKLNFFRNNVAHIGHLITQKELEEAFGWFDAFLRYMPQIKELKKELAPENIFDEKPAQEQKPMQSESVETETKEEKPQCPPEQKDLFARVGDMSSAEQQKEIDILDKYKWFTTVIEGPSGKKGLRHADGHILIPAIYDDIVYTYDCLQLNFPVLPALKNGKCGLVKCDGTGTPTTDFCYDRIELVPYNPHVFYYWKGGSLSFGLLLITGTEICPCIIDGCYEPMQTCMIFRSGNYYGLYDLGERIVMPIYDNIEWISPDDPLEFTRNGVIGYLDADLKFVPKSEVDAIEDEDERHDRLLEFLTPQIDYC